MATCTLLKVRVADVLGDLCQRMNVPYFMDASVNMEIQGYIVTKQMPARAAMESLMQAYLIDAYEADGRIVFVARGGPVRATYTTDDLDAHTYGSDPTDVLSIQRTNESELPRKINIQYVDPDREYEQSLQYASRLAGRAVSETTLEWAIAMNADDAAQIAEKLLASAWVGREQVGPFRLPYTEINLRPTDVIEITDEGVTNRIRVNKINYQSSGTVECTGVIECEGQYTSDAIGIHGAFAGSNPPSVVGDVTGHWLDINLLADTHDPDGVYVVAGSDELFFGAMFQTSLDDGATWLDTQWIDDEPTMGEAATALAAHSADTVDRANTLRVTLLKSTDTLASIGLSTALSRTTNAAILGDELIIFETATLVSPGVYDLTGLHRGLRGTDTAAAHAIGDRFILLNDSAVYRVQIPDSRLSSTIKYRFVPYDEEPSSVSPLDVTYHGYAYWPYAVAHLAAVDAGGGDYDVSWVRRTRLDGEWRDNVDVPLSEVAESYRVEVWNGLTKVHSANTFDQYVTVPAVAGNTIVVRQFSDRVGYGYSRSITL